MCKIKQVLIEKARQEADNYYICLLELKRTLVREMFALARHHLDTPPLYGMVVDRINQVVGED